MSSKSDTRIQRELYDLPGTIEGICRSIESILRGGSVQRIILELGRPVRVYRAISTNECVEDSPELDAVLRNVEMFEPPLGDLPPLRVLFNMLDLLVDEKVHPVFFVTGANHTGKLGKWIGKDFRVRREEILLGIPLRRINSIPEETLVLCGSPFKDSDLDDISIAIKTTIEIKEKKDEREELDGTSGTVWGNPGEHSSTDGTVEVLAGRNSSELRFPAGNTGER